MPAKLGGSPYYYCRRKALPGYGNTGWISSRSRRKRIAQHMEHLLEELADRALLDSSWYALLDAICRSRSVPLADALRAKREGTLRALKRSLHDPPIEVVSTEFLRTNPEPAVVTGIEQLRGMISRGERMSYLADGKTITGLCLRHERPAPDARRSPRPRQRKPNTVRRQLLRAISHLVRFHYGEAERSRIFADVQYRGERDVRRVELSREEIARLIAACSEVDFSADGVGREMQIAIRLALLTSADRGELFAGERSRQGKTRIVHGLTAGQVQIYAERDGRLSGKVLLRSEKTPHRSRTVALPDGICRDLLAHCQHKRPDDQVFASISYSQADHLFRRVRERAGLPHVRLKDLRKQYAIYGEEARIPQTVLMRTMGHRSEEMTRRYQERATVLSAEQAEALSEAMFGRTG